MSENVFERIRKIIVEQLDIPEESVTLESRLVEDIKADSLDVVELIMDIEQEFGIEIPDDQLPKVSTVKDIVDYIEQHA